MRTSLNEIKQLEEFIFQQCSAEESILLQAKLILDDELRKKLFLQKEVYPLIQLYGRMKLKQELNAVHENLFIQPEHFTFRKKIEKLFNKL